MKKKVHISNRQLFEYKLTWLVCKIDVVKACLLTERVKGRWIMEGCERVHRGVL